MSLSGKQVRFLRGLGHHLKPVVMIGKEELTDAVVATADEALEKHELIKVKLQEGCLADRRDIAAQLARLTGAGVAQILGRVILLYRQSSERIISLP